MNSYVVKVHFFPIFILFHILLLLSDLLAVLVVTYMCLVVIEWKR